MSAHAPVTVVPAGYYPPYVMAPVYRPVRGTNGLAIASLVVSLHALGIPGVGLVGAILGHVGRRRIAETGEEGDGLALAGIIIGWLSTALWGLLVAFWIVMIVWAVNSGA